MRPAYNDRRADTPEQIAQNYRLLREAVRRQAQNMLGQGSLGLLDHVLGTLGSTITAATDEQMREALPHLVDKARRDYQLAGMYARAVQNPNLLLMEASTDDSHAGADISGRVERLFKQAVPPSERRVA